MLKKVYKQYSIYLHFIRIGTSSGTEDIENKPLEEKYRKFDMQNISIFSIAWDYQGTSIFFWTIDGLREKGTFFKKLKCI